MFTSPDEDCPQKRERSATQWRIQDIDGTLVLWWETGKKYNRLDRLWWDQFLQRTCYMIVSLCVHIVNNLFPCVIVIFIKYIFFIFRSYLDPCFRERRKYHSSALCHLQHHLPFENHFSEYLLKVCWSNCWLSMKTWEVKSQLTLDGWWEVNSQSALGGSWEVTSQHLVDHGKWTASQHFPPILGEILRLDIHCKLVSLRWDELLVYIL